MTPGGQSDISDTLPLVLTKGNVASPPSFPRLEFRSGNTTICRVKLTRTRRDRGQKVCKGKQGR